MWTWGVLDHGVIRESILDARKDYEPKKLPDAGVRLSAPGGLNRRPKRGPVVAFVEIPQLTGRCRWGLTPRGESPILVMT